MLEFLDGKDIEQEEDDYYTGLESLGTLICRSISIIGQRIKLSGGEIMVKMKDKQATAITFSMSMSIANEHESGTIG